MLTIADLADRTDLAFSNGHIDPSCTESKEILRYAWRHARTQLIRSDRQALQVLTELAHSRSINITDDDDDAVLRQLAQSGELTLPSNCSSVRYFTYQLLDRAYDDFWIYLATRIGPAQMVATAKQYGFEPPFQLHEAA